MLSENRCPNVGLAAPVQPRRNPRKNTPILQQRRTLQQRLTDSGPVLSPLKQTPSEAVRRKSAGTPATFIRKPKPAIVEHEASGVLSRLSRDSRPLLLEVFAWLDARSLVDAVAPVCKLWNDVAHSKTLWSVLRPQDRLVDQLVVLEKLTERRSKGRIWKCKRLGSGHVVLLRVVDLKLTNAGIDDGVPTSFLREAALLRRLQHPNVIRHHGAEMLDQSVAMCTEYVHENFQSWQRRLFGMTQDKKMLQIKVKFGQLLTGLSYMHHHGIMHRNLKPDNIFLDQDGIVKIGDFTSTRMLDIPVQAYTPEDPKERDRSRREMRRLYYRAPEVILRDEIYGPKVDAWAVGCLLAEAASGRALFESESEVDHLFRVFRTRGTPTPESWPEALAMKDFSPKFPVYSRFDLAQVVRATVCSNEGDMAELLRQATVPNRHEILKALLDVADVLGAEGMFVFDALIQISPSQRAGADTALCSPFFSSEYASSNGAPSTPGKDFWETPPLHPDVQHWLHDGLPESGCLSGSASGNASGESGAGPIASLSSSRPSSSMDCCGCPSPRSLAVLSRLRDFVAEALVGAAGAERRGSQGSEAAVTSPWAAPRGVEPAALSHARAPPVSLPHLMSEEMVWNIHRAMQEEERRNFGGRCVASPPPPRLAGLDAEARAKLVDFVAGVASNLGLTDYTLHLGTCILDTYLQSLASNEETVKEEKFHSIGAACLKIADVFAERSKEYYKQENIGVYAAEATLHVASPEQILACEKEILPRLAFDLHMPTVQWFVQFYLVCSRLTRTGNVAKTACFLGDLLLLDAEMLRYPPSLRAQCAMTLAAYLVQVRNAKGMGRPLVGPRRVATTASRADVAAAAAGVDVHGVAGRCSASSSSSVSARCDDTEHGELALPYLEHWDLHARRWACQSNNRVDAEMCMKAVVRCFTVQRREWKTLGLSAVEAKYLSLSRTLTYPGSFPSSKLVRYVLADEPDTIPVVNGMLSLWSASASA